MILALKKYGTNSCSVFCRLAPVGHDQWWRVEGERDKYALIYYFDVLGCPSEFEIFKLIIEGEKNEKV